MSSDNGDAEADRSAAVQERGLELMETGIGGIQNLAPQILNLLTTGGGVMPSPLSFVRNIMENWETYTPEMKTRLSNQASSLIGGAREASLSSVANRFAGASTGLGRSASGALGAANLANIESVGRQLQSDARIEEAAAKQRIPDLLRALAVGEGFIKAMTEPERQVALAQMGALQGFTGAAGTFAQLSEQAANAPGPLDFLGALPGQVLGAAGAAGGFGLGAGATEGLFA